DLAQIERAAQVCQGSFAGAMQRARSGVGPVERAALGTILETTVSILGSRLKRAGVALEMKVPAGLPEVKASRGGLEQLFLNLFTNALDAMPAGGRLKVQAHPAGGRVEVKVGDTGAGLPAEQLRR